MSLLLLLLLLLCLLFTALLAAIKLYFSLTKGVFRSADYDLTGKVILLTGGNTGIGEAYVREVARRGATVIMAVRNVARGEAVAAKVRAETGTGNGNDRLHVLHCDLGELASVRRCAERIRNPKKSGDNFSAPPRIDVFVVFAAAVGENSAEGAKARLTPAPDRLEVQFQVNYLGHFLLLALLFDLLSPHARVVVTSSAAHLLGKLDLERMATEKSRHVYFTYADSKLALVAWARELAERLENSPSPKNSQITVNCFSPGTVLTNGITHNYFWWIRLLLRALAFLYGSRTAEDGAQTMLYLSMAEEKELVVTGSSGGGGGYFADCRPAAYNRLADDRKLRAGLWKLSLSLLTEKERGLLSIDEVDPLLR